MSGFSVGDRGQYAATPFGMPWKAWRQVLRRVRERLAENNFSVIAAGVAFYCFLSVFPGLIALVAIYGLVANQSEVQTHLATFEGLIPQEAYRLIAQRLEEISGTGRTNLGLGLAISVALALWSATKGVKSLMTAMNIAYRQEETRGIVWQNVFAILFTVGGVLFVVVSLGLIAGIPAAVAVLGPSGLTAMLLLWLRWVALAALVLVALTILYRYAPRRSHARIRWIVPGAVAACLLWLLLSGAFSVYVRNFGDYEKTFGSLGAVVVLLMWFYLSAFVVCIGAVLNAELEYQTYRDSTVGPNRRSGRRGAYVADRTWQGRPKT